MRTILLAIATLSALATTPSLACGPGGSTRDGMASAPPLAALLDAQLPTAKLADEDMTKLKSMRAQIASLEAKNETDAAREVEEKAMLMLGFSKAWTACGPGSFIWMKMPTPKAS